ncbi:hypothetical protein BDY19DRAFT_909816 [Irpex rosettiformis]|uniref:Uncharacterized protein n=1 Tax=Irpex rosettiformis TaxID=378272 RepID=A0ACB8TRL9_9APHY|nr:hypothetical protein BDY19DRAFT_909816 [Irpex rosettiformis]
MSLVSEVQRGYAVVKIHRQLYLNFYKCCITLSSEISVVWTRQWIQITWLYACTRYTTLLMRIIVFLPDSTYVSCKIILLVLDGLQSLQTICIASMRIYALNGKVLVAGVVFALNIVPFATNLYSTTQFNYSASIVLANNQGCQSVTNISEDLSLLCKHFTLAQGIFSDRGLTQAVSLTTRIAVILADILVLLVTWFKTAQLYKESRQLGIQAPLATLLLRDGTLYFCILLVVNVLQPLVNVVPSLIGLDFAEPYLVTMPPIIVCRFILNLRQVKPAGSSWLSGGQSVNLRFVGNMGEALHFGADEGGEDFETPITPSTDELHDPPLEATDVEELLDVGPECNMVLESAGLMDPGSDEKSFRGECVESGCHTIFDGINEIERDYADRANLEGAW